VKSEKVTTDEKKKEKKKDYSAEKAPFLEKLEKLRYETGKTNAELAPMFGSTPASFKALIGDSSRRISRETLDRAKDVFGCSLLELIDPDLAALYDEDKILVPYFSLRPAAGFDGVAENTVPYEVKGMPFSKRWLRQELKVVPENVCLFNIKGDSMEPKLNSGDLVIVDKGAVEASFQEGVWLLRVGSMIMIKRVHMPKPNELRAVSDNALYPPITLEPNSDYELIGRVVSRFDNNF